MSSHVISCHLISSHGLHPHPTPTAMAAQDVREIVAEKRQGLRGVFDKARKDDEEGLRLGDFCALLRARGLVPRPVSNDSAGEIFRRAQGAADDGNGTDVMVFTEWIEAVAALAAWIYPS